MFPSLNLPKADLKLTRKDGVVYVWCIVRKKNLVLTPEEWVRQHIIHFLIEEKNIPKGLIASEFALKYNGRLKRADVVVFNHNSKPLFIVECKAPEVDLSEKTLHQIAQYNFELKVDLLLLTNGLTHIMCIINRKEHRLDYLHEIPSFEQMIAYDSNMNSDV